MFQAAPGLDRGISVDSLSCVLTVTISLCLCLLQLAADPDPNVKSGSELLDRLLKVFILGPHLHFYNLFLLSVCTAYKFYHWGHSS